MAGTPKFAKAAPFGKRPCSPKGATIRTVQSRFVICPRNKAYSPIKAREGVSSFFANAPAKKNLLSHEH
jgi:hypothetical protein